MAYTTLALLKVYLGIPATDTDDDALLTVLVGSAQAIVEAYTDRKFEVAAATTRYFTIGKDTHGPTLLFDADCIAITSVTNGDGTVITAAQYITMPRNEFPWFGIKVLRSSDVIWQYTAQSDPEDAIVVVGKFAYSLTAPADIVHITQRVAAYLYRQRDNVADLDRPIIVGNTTILPGQLPSDIRMLLEPYRRLV